MIQSKDFRDAVNDFLNGRCSWRNRICEQVLELVDEFLLNIFLCFQSSPIHPFDPRNVIMVAVLNYQSMEEGCVFFPFFEPPNTGLFLPEIFFLLASPVELRHDLLSFSLFLLFSLPPWLLSKAFPCLFPRRFCLEKCFQRCYGTIFWGFLWDT